mmetsp:Transcript_11586/g.18505  ORF Transcript_11586/g.18505 Transcript_11586/m.18505 type:complete len:97 (+) Transcript_11586:1323-1613(+)
MDRTPLPLRQPPTHQKWTQPSPSFFDKGLAFMFETTYMLGVSDKALNSKHREYTYQECWKDMPETFSKTKKRLAEGSSDGSDILTWRKRSKARNGN